MTTDEAIEQLRQLVEPKPHARPALAHLLDEVERLRRRCDKMEDALSNIVRSEPAMQEGRCFYPQFNQDGDEVGVVDVDPISLIQGMVNTAAEALFDDPAAEAARKGAGK